MKQQGIDLALSSDGHHQRIHDQRIMAFRLHRPTDNAAGEEVKNHGHMQPVFGSPEMREIAQPFLILAGDDEIQVKDIVGDHRALTFVLWLAGRFGSAHKPFSSCEPGALGSSAA